MGEERLAFHGLAMDGLPKTLTATQEHEAVRGGAERTGRYSQRISEECAASREGGLGQNDEAPCLDDMAENIMARSFGYTIQYDLAISTIRKGTPVAESNIPHTKNDEL